MLCGPETINNCSDIFLNRTICHKFELNKAQRSKVNLNIIIGYAPSHSNRYRMMHEAIQGRKKQNTSLQTSAVFKGPCCIDHWK